MQKNFCMENNIIESEEKRNLVSWMYVGAFGAFLIVLQSFFSTIVFIDYSIGGKSLVNVSEAFFIIGLLILGVAFIAGSCYMSKIGYQGSGLRTSGISVLILAVIQTIGLLAGRHIHSDALAFILVFTIVVMPAICFCALINTGGREEKILNLGGYGMGLLFIKFMLMIAIPTLFYVTESYGRFSGWYYRNIEGIAIVSSVLGFVGMVMLFINLLTCRKAVNALESFSIYDDNSQPEYQQPQYQQPEYQQPEYQQPQYSQPVPPVPPAPPVPPVETPVTPAVEEKAEAPVVPPVQQEADEDELPDSF